MERVNMEQSKAYYHLPGLFECCDFNCYDRKKCYENVSRKALGEECEDHICVSDKAKEGYRFSNAMNTPACLG